MPAPRPPLWVTSVVRPIRFHDLRHTTGSLLTMHGANLSAVQRIMRHKDPRITSETYLHLDPSYLRREIDRLSFGDQSDQTEPVRGTPAAPLVSIVCLEPEGGGSERDRLALEPMAPEVLTMERAIGFEPTTFNLGRTRLPSQRLAALINHAKGHTFRRRWDSSLPRL
jgi:hypothetical protein